MKNHEITVEKLEELYACEEGIEQFVVVGGDLLKLDPQYYLWGAKHFPDLVDLDHLDECVKQYPHHALVYVANRLTPERLDWCAEQYPRSALHYAAYILTPKRLDWCAKKEPDFALIYATNFLTPKRLDWCAKRHPHHALWYAANLLTPKRLDWCNKKRKRRIKKWLCL